MLTSLLYALKQRNATDANDFPDLPEGAHGLPRLTSEPCVGCGACSASCPTGAIAISSSGGAASVTLDRGLCISCSACVEVCPSKTIVYDPSTRTAVVRREDLVLRQHASPASSGATVPLKTPFCRSVDIREVSTGCNATDLEVSATTNPVFDCSRFGIHYVASPRFADALVVTGPVARAMQQPLIRCYEAMAEPRIVIAVGTCAISGGLHRGGYAEANGVTPHVPISAFVPGCPPHPWSIIHGILLAVGSKEI